MTNGERAEAFLRPILDEGGGSGDKESDDDTVTELEIQFDAVRKTALDEMEAKSAALVMSCGRFRAASNDMMAALEKRLLDARRQALDEILEWIVSESSSPPEPAATICLEARAEFEKRWGPR